MVTAPKRTRKRKTRPRTVERYVCEPLNPAGAAAWRRAFPASSKDEKDLEPERDLYVDLFPPGAPDVTSGADEILFHRAAVRNGLADRLFRYAPRRPELPALPMIEAVALRITDESGAEYVRGHNSWRGDHAPDPAELRAAKLEYGYAAAPDLNEDDAVDIERCSDPAKYSWLTTDLALIDPWGEPSESLLCIPGAGGVPTDIDDAVDALAAGCFDDESGLDDEDLEALITRWKDKQRAALRLAALPYAEAVRLNILDILESDPAAFRPPGAAPGRAAGPVRITLEIRPSPPHVSTTEPAGDRG